MSNEVPTEFQDCFYMSGDSKNAGVFGVNFPDDADFVQYASIGRDDEGVFLLTVDGEKTRITNGSGEEFYEETEGHSFIRLLIVNRYGENDDEYDIVRLPPEQTMALGA
jgi:hypothetical protein